jgi:hypothetical protein
MIKVTVDSRAVKAALAEYPKIASRSLEIAIDKTAMAIKEGEVAEMKRVFSKPTPYTLNSLKVTRTKGHNMKATVWFKEPDRMEDHYLLPSVEGGERKLKGFERAFANNKFVPGEGSAKDTYGNVPNSQIRQILGVLGKAERAGYQANLTAKSAKRNKKPRDYVWFPRGLHGGALPPGIYQRVATGAAITTGQRRRVKTFGTFEQGKRRVGVFYGKKSRYRIEQNIIRARGLRPILIRAKQHGHYKPLFKFYEVAHRIHSEVFIKHFLADFSRRMPR